MHDSKDSGPYLNNQDSHFTKKPNFNYEPDETPSPNDFHAGYKITDESPDELGDLEHKIIDFERQWWKHAGAKDNAIRDRFGMSATRYYQVLNALIDRPAAAAYDPLVVHRLQRLRDARKAQRSARLRDLA